MQAELQAQLLKSVDEAAQFAGAKDYDDMMGQMATVLKNLQVLLKRISTKHELVALFNEAGEIPHEEQIYLVGMIQSFPALARMFLTVQLPKLADELPALPTGRKQTLTLGQRIQVIEFISDLFKAGVSMQASKERAAQRFGVSVRSIERTWRKRHEINLEKPNIPVEELIAWISKSEEPA